MIMISLSIAAHHPPPSPIKIGTDPHVKCRIRQAAKSLSLNSLRNSTRGFFITGYCLGRRFLTRGSYRPGRSGLTTSSGISSPSSAPRSHLSASMKLTRSASYTLTARRLAHRHPHQVVCQGIHRQFLEHSIHCHALQHIHLHRLLQRLQVFLYPPPHPIKFRQRISRVRRGVQERGHQRHFARPEPRRRDPIPQLTHHDRLGQLPVLVRAHPHGAPHRLEIFDHLIHQAAGRHPAAAASPWVPASDRAGHGHGPA